jgi:hypothetical protein
MNEVVFGRVLDPMPDPYEILTVQQAAAILNISYSHMLRFIKGSVDGMPPVNHLCAGHAS